MSTSAQGTTDLDELAGYLRSHPALRAKGEITLVGEVLGPGSWVHGPGDDGAVVSAATGPPSAGGDAGQVIACGEALLPAFVASDPYGAGIAAVLTNVNDLAAMGAVPLAIVDTIVGSADLAREALRGMKEACAWYDVAAGRRPPHAARRTPGPVGVRGRSRGGRALDNPRRGGPVADRGRVHDRRDAHRLPLLPVLRGACRRPGRRRAGARRRRVLGRLRRRQGREHGRTRRFAGDAAGVEWPGGDGGPGTPPPPRRSLVAGVAHLLPGVRVPAVLAAGTRGGLYLCVPGSRARGGVGRADRH